MQIQSGLVMSLAQILTFHHENIQGGAKLGLHKHPVYSVLPMEK